MATKAANAAQRQWRRNITEWAYDNIHTLYGLKYLNSNFQRHHVLGRSATHNNVAIGHWFIIPVPFELHDVSSNHPLNVTHHKRAFTEKYGMQRDLFLQMVEAMRDDCYELPPADVCEAIRLTKA